MLTEASMAAIAGRCKILCSDNNIVAYGFGNILGSRETMPCDAIQTKISIRILKRKRYGAVVRALSSFEKHRKSLDSYIGKIHDDASLMPLKILNHREQLSSNVDEPVKLNVGLRSVENYFRRAEVELQSAEYETSSDDVCDENHLETETAKPRPLKNYMEFRSDDNEANPGSGDEALDFYSIGALASINIAVFLFEIATPVKNSDFQLFSLPTIYGAKINSLILTGEWWRLLTPMFLHAGIFHILLGNWILFTFGVPVSREYGSFTFVLIYILGGISGNLISFLHTPDPTVGGTGPVFAIMGAWLIYQLQNKDVIPKDASEKMFLKAVIATALSFIISSFGPIDDWAHFASALTGIGYGFLTCPSFQVRDASPESGQDERITLVRGYTDACKSSLCFSIFVAVLSSLVFIFEPPLDL